MSRKPVQWTQDVSCERTEGHADITIRTLDSLHCFAATTEHFTCRILYANKHLN